MLPGIMFPGHQGYYSVFFFNYSRTIKDTILYFIKNYYLVPTRILSLFFFIIILTDYQEYNPEYFLDPQG